MQITWLLRLIPWYEAYTAMKWRTSHDIQYMDAKLISFLPVLDCYEPDSVKCHISVTKAHLGREPSTGWGRQDGSPRTRLFICLTDCFVFWPLACASRLLKKLSTAVEHQGSIFIFIIIIFARHHVSHEHLCPLLFFLRREWRTLQHNGAVL